MHPFGRKFRDGLYGKTELDKACDVHHIYLVITSPNSGQGTCFAPSIRRAKSQVTVPAAIE
jgi:hypothetical protein